MSEFQCKCIRYSVYIYVAIGALAIIGTRLHYSLDVSIAIYLTHRNFRRYHEWCKYERLKSESSMFRWLEAEEILSVEKAAYKIVRMKKNVPIDSKVSKHGKKHGKHH
jgi:hypothetical protein